MATVYRVGTGERITLDPAKSLGKGGEADVFAVGQYAAKIFKKPNHPDYQGDPDAQKAAEERIHTHQQKLRNFPFARLPKAVVSPVDLLSESKTGGTISGYLMELLSGVEVLLRYGQRSFRESGGISNADVTKIFQNLHPTVKGTHTAGVVLGDFNNLNVLVTTDYKARVVDADSMQNSSYLCKLYTAQFVDPRLCDPTLTTPMLIKPHDIMSDWLAFAHMYMESLLYVGFWGGVYKPKDPTKKIPHGARPLRGVSVFNSEVIYPKPAIHYSVLPDEALHFLYEMAEKGKREEFPFKLTELTWTKCTKCGTEHARGACPNCTTAVPSANNIVTQVRGKVTSSRVFKTSGVIVFATVQNGKLLYVYHENGQYMREDGRVVLHGNLDPQMRYRIQGPSTLLAKGNVMVTLTDGNSPEQTVVDSYGQLPLIDANASYRYWVEGGYLKRNDILGPEIMGTTLQNQTLFWVGPEFGFGFYRAGDLCEFFVFDKHRKGIHDSIKVPALRGQLVDSTSVFTKDRCWFFTTTREGTQTINRCVIVKADGTVEATDEKEDGDGSWLGSIRGKLAVGNFLLSPTDSGIIRVEPDNGRIRVTQEFPDTEPFVDQGSYLYPASNGIYMVGRKEILVLTIA